MNYHIPLIVWGKRHVNTYLSLSLPSQMTPGNLEYLASNAKVFYYLFAPKSEYESMEKFDLFQKLKRLVNFKWIELKNCDFSRKFNVVNECHKKIIEEVKTADPMLFPYPDLVYAENAYRTLHKLVMEGMRLISMAAIRIHKEKFAHLLQERALAFPLSSRDVAKLALESLHLAVKSMFWDREQINSWPSHLYWRLDDQGILVRAFHNHPFMIWPEKIDLKPFVGIESYFQENSCPSQEKRKIITDSDDFFCIEVSTEEGKWIESLKNKSIKLIARWLVGTTASIHHNFVMHRQFIHANGIKDEWKSIVSHSDRVIDGILSRYRNPTLADHIHQLCRIFKRVLRSILILLKFR